MECLSPSWKKLASEPSLQRQAASPSVFWRLIPASPPFSPACSYPAIKFVGGLGKSQPSPSPPSGADISTGSKSLKKAVSADFSASKNLAKKLIHLFQI
jgi:hypothetical protein